MTVGKALSSFRPKKNVQSDRRGRETCGNLVRQNAAGGMEAG